MNETVVLMSAYALTSLSYGIIKMSVIPAWFYYSCSFSGVSVISFDIPDNKVYRLLPSVIHGPDASRA